MKNTTLKVDNPLSLRLLRRILIFSALALLVLAGLRAWWEYQTVLNSARQSVDAILETQTKGLAGSLWAVSYTHLTLPTIYSV